jgi:hypothetical protein
MDAVSQLSVSRTVWENPVKAKRTMEINSKVNFCREVVLFFMGKILECEVEKKEEDMMEEL